MYYIHITKLFVMGFAFKVGFLLSVFIFFPISSNYVDAGTILVVSFIHVL